MKAILTYHSIDSSGSPISVDEESFRANLAWIAASGVEVVSLGELFTLPSSAHAIALTFDDAFANFADVAWPLLRERALPVTLFVPTDHVGGHNLWDRTSAAGGIPRLRLCDWDTLGRLSEEGVTLGAHTRTHADLTKLSEAALVDQLAGSAERLLMETGVLPPSFAYPYGRLNDRVVAGTRLYYALACTTELRFVRADEDPVRLPRLDAFYLRDRRWLEHWGTPSLERRVWVRGRARAVRSFFAGVGAAL